MQKVHLAPIWSLVAGSVALFALATSGSLSTAGMIAGLLYLGVSDAMLARGLLRSHATRFGVANAVTALRSTLVGIVTALVATSFSAEISVPLLIGLTVPALALDAIDGWIARRTHTTTELGARFDMEVDAFLILALSVYVSQDLGWWVLSIGLMRYALLAAEAVIPRLRATVPPRYWRKVVAAIAGITLTLVASEWFARGIDSVVTLLALGLLIESFGRDVMWLLGGSPDRVGRRTHSAGRLVGRRAWPYSGG